MSNINLRRFVDINIKKHITKVTSGTRDTIVLYTSEGVSTSKEITSLEEAIAYCSEMPNALAYLKVYFNNGGAKALVISGKGYDSVTITDLKQLDNKYIVVAFAAATINQVQALSAIKQLAVAMAADKSVYGINEKLLLASTKDENDEESINNLIIKYSSVQGAEMTIAAYLSRINVYAADSIYDYAYSQENIKPEEIDDNIFGKLMDNNINVDVYLSSATRVCGGNCKDGSDIVNKYVNIILHQTLTDQLLSLLTSKIKNESGLGKIYSTIAQELEKYKNAGYLTVDKFWKEDDLSVSYNGTKYVIIQKGELLNNGYKVRILPLSSLTDSDKAAHKAPPIYIVLADQYGIRQITINGEVI